MTREERGHLERLQGLARESGRNFWQVLVTKCAICECIPCSCATVFPVGKLEPESERLGLEEGER